MLEKIDKLFERMKNHCREKEANFLQSIRTQWIQKGSLSEGQVNWFESLEEKYSEEKMLDEQKWSLNWSRDHQLTADRIASYYAAQDPPYFSSLVDRIQRDPKNFTLSKKEWDKFCENKYAKRIRLEYDTKPRFQSGDYVQIRKRNKLIQANYYRFAQKHSGNGDRVGFVIAVNAKPITRAAKGSRIYQVLLAGDTSPVFAHESDLKKGRKLKNGK